MCEHKVCVKLLCTRLRWLLRTRRCGGVGMMVGVMVGWEADPRDLVHQVPPHPLVRFGCEGG